MLEATGNPAAETDTRPNRDQLRVVPPGPSGPLEDFVWDAAVADHLRFFRGNTRAAYEYDLKIFTAWCRDNGIQPLQVTRLQVEAFFIHCETARGNSLRTIKRRVTTLRRLYALLADDGVITKSPVEMARLRRRYADDSDAPTAEQDLGLTRFEMSAMLHAAAASRPVDLALVTLMAGLGLRVSEACNLKVGDTLHMADSHRVIRFVGKGGKPAVIPMPPFVWRAVQPLTHRDPGELLLQRPNTGTPMNRVSAARIVARVARVAGIERHVTPHDLRRGFVSGMLDAGASLRQAQTAARHADPRMTMLYDRRRRALDGHASYILAAWLGTGAL